MDPPPPNGNSIDVFPDAAGLVVAVAGGGPAVGGASDAVDAADAAGAGSVVVVGSAAQRAEGAAD